MPRNLPLIQIALVLLITVAGPGWQAHDHFSGGEVDMARPVDLTDLPARGRQHAAR